MDIYEETMPLFDSGKDYSIYFIPESMSIYERINTILKKGPSFQKEHFLSHIHFYINNTSIFPSLLNFISEEIDMWDSNLQITFANGLFTSLSLLINTTSSINAYSTHVLLLSIRFLQKAIANYEERVSTEYSITFSKLASLLTEHKLKLNLTNEIIQFANSLGKFGQDAKNRRISVFLCCTLLKICIDFNEILFKRIILLSSDVELVVKRQMAYELNGLIKIVPYEHLKELIISAVDILLNNNNNDIVSYTEALCAIIDIDTIKICLSIQYKLSYTFIVNAFNRIFNEDNAFDIISKAFIALLAFVNKSNSEINNHHQSISSVTNEDTFALLEPIRQFIRIFYCNSNNKHIKFFIEYYDHITKVFSNDSNYLNELLDYLCEAIPLLEDDVKRYTYGNLSKVFFNNNNTNNGNTNYNSLIEKLQIKQNLLLVIDTSSIIQLITVLIESEKHCILKVILDNIDTIQLSVIKSSVLCIVLTALKKTIKYIYDNKESHYPNSEAIYKKLIAISKEFILGSKGYTIQSKAIQVITSLIKYSIEKDNLNEYISSFIFKSASFLYRRLSIPFIIESIEVFSLSNLVKLNIFTSLINIIKSETIPSIQVKAIEVFKTISILLKHKGYYEEYNSTIAIIQLITSNDTEVNKAISLLLSNTKENTDEDSITDIKLKLHNDQEKQRDEEKMKSKDSSTQITTTLVDVVILRKPKVVSRSKNSKQLPPVVINYSASQTSSSTTSSSCRHKENQISFNNFHQIKALSYKSNNDSFYKPKESPPNLWNPLFHKDNGGSLMKIPSIKLNTANNRKSLIPFKHETSKDLRRKSTNISFNS